MLTANEYFSSTVKSLGYETSEGKSTVGVMEPGDYEFGTDSHEIMTVVEGELVVTLPGETGSTAYKAGQTFEVLKNSSFKVTAIDQTAYLCKYR